MKLLWLPCLLLVSCAPGTGPVERKVIHQVDTIADLPFAKPGGVELLMDLHLPKGVVNPPLVMSIHGGGWQTGDRKRCRSSWLVKHGYAVANIEYRMSHEAVFPAQIHDCKGALRWLRAQQKKYGYNAEKVVVVGYSAGGHLATLLGTSHGVQALEGNTAGHPNHSSAVQGFIDYFGPVDFIQRSKSQPNKTEKPKGIVYQLLGGSVTGNPGKAQLASPVTHVGKGDPPALILHGEKDRQVLPAQSQRLHEVYQAKGLEPQLLLLPEKGHGWGHPLAEEEKLVLEFLGKVLRPNLKSKTKVTP